MHCLVKQFTKKNNKWYEKSINKKQYSTKYEFVNVITNIKNLEKKIEINLSKNQKIIEFSPLAYKYLNIISKKINTFQGGLLIVDYGYFKKKMKDSLQSIYKHQF